jgi:hypothetical protein
MIHFETASCSLFALMAQSAFSFAASFYRGTFGMRHANAGLVYRHSCGECPFDPGRDKDSGECPY